MNTVLPTTIPAYLAQLRKSLEGADAAMIQDALYDAEEYLRAELAANPGKTEAEIAVVPGVERLAADTEVAAGWGYFVCYLLVVLDRHAFNHFG